jgi:hypothetical protein
LAIEHLGTLIITQLEGNLLTDALQVYANCAHKSIEFVHFFFRHQQFPEFLGRMSEPVEIRLLFWFIKRCLSFNHSLYPEEPLISQELSEQLIELLSGPLNSEDAESVQWAAHALSGLVNAQNVGDCFARGIWNVLGRALEFFELFATKVEVLRAMCQLIVHAKVKEVAQLIERDFFEIVETYGEQMILAMPFEVVDALGQIEQYAEMEGNDEWMGKIFTEHVIDLLMQVREMRPETNEFILADSLLCRMEGSDVAEN